MLSRCYIDKSAEGVVVCHHGEEGDGKSDDSEEEEEGGKDVDLAASVVVDVGDAHVRAFPLDRHAGGQDSSAG